MPLSDSMGAWRKQRGLGPWARQGLQAHTRQVYRSAPWQVAWHKRYAHSAESRWHTECAALTALDGQGAPRLLDAWTDDAGHHLVCEDLAGSSLRDFCREGLSLAANRALLSAGLRMLAGLHAKHIVHGDVQPANLRVVALPMDELRVKVLDFGAAATAGARVNAAFGAARTAAPERLWARHACTATASQDLFAWTASVLAAQSGPRKALDILVRRRRGEDPWSLADAALRQRLQALEPWIRRMLAPSPAHRPQSAAQALAELRACPLATPEVDRGASHSTRLQAC